MAIEVNSSQAVCYKCGAVFSRRKGYFPVSYSVLHKGVGYIHVCKECIDNMYNGYLSQCGNARDAVRQVCRKLDLYWSDNVYEMVARKSTTRSMMTQYIAKINTITYAGKSYDDTLSEEGTLWSFCQNASDINTNIQPLQDVNDDNESDEDDDVSDEIKAFWGAGYPSGMYKQLEQRRSYWMSRFPDDMEVDIGTEAIIRQICSLELDINRDRAAGRAIDKNVNALNTLLGSASLKPRQKKSDEADSGINNTTFGEWIRRWENQEPIPEPDPELQDVDGIIRYITIWFFGHLCKMLGIKNTYCKLYEDEIERLRIDHPEYEDEDDENMFNDIFGANDSEDE